MWLHGLTRIPMIKIIRIYKNIKYMDVVTNIYTIFFFSVDIDESHQKLLFTDHFNGICVSWRKGGSVMLGLECSPSTSVVPHWNLSPGTACWKVGSYMPMPSGLQCKILTN